MNKDDYYKRVTELLEANNRLVETNRVLSRMLRASREQFAMYEKNHTEKARAFVEAGKFEEASSSIAKAETNREMCFSIAVALSR